MCSISKNKINLLIDNFTGIEKFIELFAEIPSEQISKIISDSLLWPVDTRPYFIARGISRLSAFFYHVKSDGQTWNPLTTSYYDFIQKYPDAKIWIDESQHPSSNEIISWLRTK